MALHVAHYLRRRVVGFAAQAQEFALEQEHEPDEGFARPMYHITRQRIGPITRLQPGDTIWLFSSLSSPWKTLPPSLDARIVVERREELKRGILKFHATAESQWFPLANATELACHLTTRNAQGQVSPLLPIKDGKKLGRYLQSARELVDHELVEKYSNDVLDSRYSFISYRMKDGMKDAFDYADKLLHTVQLGQAPEKQLKLSEVVFWDRYCLPRRLVERREQVSSAALDGSLKAAIEHRKCCQVWGIETPGYMEEQCYGTKERRLAQALHKYCPVDPAMLRMNQEARP